MQNCYGLSTNESIILSIRYGSGRSLMPNGDSVCDQWRVKCHQMFPHKGRRTQYIVGKKSNWRISAGNDVFLVHGMEIKRGLKVINLYTYQATITLYTYNILLTIIICGFWIDFQKSKSIELVCLSQIYLMPSPSQEKKNTNQKVFGLSLLPNWFSLPTKQIQINQSNILT